MERERATLMQKRARHYAEQDGLNSGWSRVRIWAEQDLAALRYQEASDDGNIDKDPAVRANTEKWTRPRNIRQHGRNVT